ncbi:uncharacterized protein CMU_027840 [Cryptosporidium muris RN66]|uniref:COPI associated protein n=1 Tax=Cryptosporidium muris (strain RN66) TaxID=441375 RepID=B6ABM2_CRYMR|nr:uncharacterized protein CMU_027840 [Cryptosporidium muris RN66]EEA05774.1 hypothetical protein, conserved [Cryptosporidium muris RN66]|eukprot:XP_002140123.1 hypothetical protein [Cryptosporidium muris RN66]
MKESKRLSCKYISLQTIWITCCILCIIYGLTNIIKYFVAQRLVIDFFIIFSGFIGLLSEIHCFQFFSYMLFFYTPIGRGLYIIIQACLFLNSNLLSLISSSVLISLGILYMISSALLGGVTKPLLESSLNNELNLKASIHFISNIKSNSTINNSTRVHNSDNHIYTSNEDKDSSHLHHNYYPYHPHHSHHSHNSHHSKNSDHKKIIST